MELHCSGCGAQISADLEKGIGKCRYCGNEILLEKKHVFGNLERFAVRQEELPQVPNPKYISWEDSGLKDHAMDWKDEALEAGMRKVTGITQGDIMLSDVFPMTSLTLMFTKTWSKMNWSYSNSF